MANQYRKSPRAQWIDYDGGSFFITICTKDRIHYFGEVHDGEMQLSAIGRIVNHHLKNASLFNQDIDVPLFVVMPNHIHMIVVIVGTSLCDVGNLNPIDQRNPNPSLRANPTCQRHVPTLSRYIRSFKASITIEAKKLSPDFGWQSRYHDYLIRGSRDGNKIAEYIINNPLNWNKDCFYEKTENAEP